jgi:hypothetical protein
MKTLQLLLFMSKSCFLVQRSDIVMCPDQSVTIYPYFDVAGKISLAMELLIKWEWASFFRFPFGLQLNKLLSLDTVRNEMDGQGVVRLS